MSCRHTTTLAAEVRKLVGWLEETQNCPVCAVSAALHGERDDTSVTLAKHAAGVVAVLRALVEEVPQPTAPQEENAHGSTDDRRRRVQRIPVTRL